MLNECNQIKTILPKFFDKTVKFKHFRNKLNVPFIIYADYETLFLMLNSLNKFVKYRGSNCVQVFYKRLIEDLIPIYDKIRTIAPMIPLTNSQQLNFECTDVTKNLTQLKIQK